MIKAYQNQHTPKDDMDEPLPKGRKVRREKCAESLKPMNGVERAAALWSDALKMGLNAPTEGMIAEAIHIAEHEAILHWEIIAARHGQDWESVKSLLAKEKRKGAKARRWQNYLDELDSVE